jgi:hypothetical protein
VKTTGQPDQLLEKVLTKIRQPFPVRPSSRLRCTNTRCCYDPAGLLLYDVTFTLFTASSKRF